VYFNNNLDEVVFLIFCSGPCHVMFIYFSYFHCCDERIDVALNGIRGNDQECRNMLEELSNECYCEPKREPCDPR